MNDRAKRLPAFDQALALHRAGRFAEADALYAAVPAAHPRGVDTLYLRGLLRHQQGRNQEAQAYLDAALRQRPNHAPALASYAGVLAQLGRPAEALACYDRSLVVRPDHAETLNNRGNTLRDLHRPAEALASYDRALAVAPAYVEALNNRGNALRDLHRPAEALASYDRALALKPDYPEILDNRGNALRDLGHFEAALASYERALALKPGLLQAMCNHGAALCDLKRFDQALDCYDRVLARLPDHAEALNFRGNVLRELGRHAEALASCDRAIAVRPGYAEAFNHRGNALRDLKRPVDALASYDQALTLRPDYVEALYNRGAALRALGRLDEALASYDRALARRPNSAETLNNRGAVLRDLGRTEAALASYDRAIVLKPDYAVAHDNRALTLAELGRFEEAQAAIARAIDLAPRRARSYYDLALLADAWTPDDPRLQTIAALAEDGAALPETDRLLLHFALNKAYARLGDHDRAFRHLLEGNRLKRLQLDYDEAAALGALERIRASFPAERIRAKAAPGDPSPLPVFILGMPRSGSSLVEQILASHPAMFGAGEIEAFKDAVASVGGADEAAAASIPDAAWRRIGSAYVERLQAAAPAASRITDKLPGNFQRIGLIHLALPHARIIHTRRDPVDTCLSCFTQLFAGHHPYAYDLAELGRYYRAYEALMAHWRAVLPPGIMIDIDYEALVADLDTEARRLIAHCGLDWDARCLDFHRTERPVRTASMLQVRRPLYGNAVGSWRVYERFLGPLLDALGPSAAR